MESEILLIQELTLVGERNYGARFPWRPCFPRSKASMNTYNFISYISRTSFKEDHPTKLSMIARETQSHLTSLHLFPIPMRVNRIPESKEPTKYYNIIASQRFLQCKWGIAEHG